MSQEGAFPLRSPWLRTRGTNRGNVARLYLGTTEPFSDWFFEAAAGGSITGTASIALDGVTLGATGALALRAGLAVALDGATLAAGGAVKILGALGAGLDDIGLVAAGETAAAATSPRLTLMGVGR